MKKLTEKEKIESLSRKKLTKILSYNYLAKRFWSDSDIKKSLRIIKKNESKFDFISTDKVVVIVGAGASLGAGLMLGDQAKKDLIKIVKKANKKQGLQINKKTIIKELRKNLLNKGNIELSVSKGKDVLKYADFETVIETLSQFMVIDKLIRKRLNELFRARHNPILTYEVLAHMLKYKVIDGIINFNFDELLDQSIKEELINDHYITIIGGTDFNDYYKKKSEIKKINKKKSTRNSLRYYIKPHGTFSDSESIRSTKPSYVNNYGLNKIMKSELTGKVTFLVIGFEMDSVELNAIISENQQRGKLSSEMFFIKKGRFDNFENKIYLKSFSHNYKVEKNTNEDDKFYPKPIQIHYPFESNFEKEDLRKSKLNLKELAEIDWHDLVTPNILREIFNSVQLNLTKNHHNFNSGKSELVVFPIWGIIRHEIINQLFYNLVIKYRKKGMNVDKDSVLFEDYFYLRVLIEILISISKGRTLINIFGISKGRVGVLYELYYKYSKKPKSLLFLCQRFHLINPTYSKEILMTPEEMNFYLKDNSIENYVDSLIMRFKELVSERKNKRTRDLSKLIDQKYNLSKMNIDTDNIDIKINKKKQVIFLLKRFKARIDNKNTMRNLQQYLIKTFNANPEIGHQFPTGNHLMFNEKLSHPLYSFEQLTHHLGKTLLKKDEYDTILFSPHILDELWLNIILKQKKDNKKILILYENTPANKYFSNSIKFNELKKDSICLNWWDHKRSSFILLNKNIPVYCIYYYHGTKSQLISPILIDNIKSKKNKPSTQKQILLNRVYQNFLAYIIKSKGNNYLKKTLQNPKETVNILDSNILEKIIFNQE